MKLNRSSCGAILHGELALEDQRSAKGQCFRNVVHEKALAYFLDDRSQE